MKNLLYRLYAYLTGKNSVNTPVEVITEQLLERRALPTGMAEYKEWEQRIISGAGLAATEQSQGFALGGMICALGPTEAFKEDGYFINGLRASAAKQLAVARMEEMRAEHQAKQMAERKAAQELAEAKFAAEQQAQLDVAEATAKNLAVTPTSEVTHGRQVQSSS